MTLPVLIASLVAFGATVALGRAFGTAPSGGDADPFAGPPGGPWKDAAERRSPLANLSFRIGRDLAGAGLGTPAARFGFVLVHLLSIAVGALAALALLSDLIPAGPGRLAAALVGGTLGWWIPHAWLEWRRTRRRIEIASDFPVMLDLLQISMQGGMGLSAAWQAVAQSLEGVGEALGEEMRRIDLEVTIGASWGPTLTEAAERTGVGEFRSLGALLGQTERFGTEVALMVRVLADSIRHEELQALEERAHRASVKMLFPLAAMLMPALLLLVIGPMLLLLLDALQQASAD